MEAAMHSELSRRFVGAMTILVSSVTAVSAELKPVSLEAFFIAPDQPVVLKWIGAPAAEGAKMRYSIADFAGRTVTESDATSGSGGIIEVPVRLKSGYYEIALPREGQSFGIVALPEHSGRADSFFCVDSAISWLEERAEVREPLVRILKRCGIAVSRERLHWADIQPEKQKWDWQSSHHYDDLRQTYARNGVKVLEMFHDAPAWIGASARNRYPQDLVAVAQSWARIGRRWANCWVALEVWNEPDIFFGSDLPADQYVPLVKAVAWGLEQAKTHTPLMGLVATDGCPDEYRQACADNGLLDHVDAISFHTYRDAATIEQYVRTYRAWLKSKPLWITESGRPWSKGPPRPPADQDARSALDITMKAIEARACGVGGYCAFVYPYYEEGTNNFGMMGKEVTPLRSMAAYAQAVAALSHKPYVGDLRCDDAGLKRARVFGDAKQAVAVLYTGKIQADAVVKIAARAVRIEGIDGRALQATSDGTIPIPDGLTYIWLDQDEIKKRVWKDTPAAQLCAAGRLSMVKWTTALPIVLQHVFDPKTAWATNRGYAVYEEHVKHFPIHVRIHNLGDQPDQVKLRIEYIGADRRIKSTEPRSCITPAGGFVDVDWTLDLSDASHGGGVFPLAVTSQAKSDRRVSPLSIPLIVEGTVEDNLSRFENKTPLPIDKPDAWRSNVSNGGSMTLTAAPDKHWRLETRFGPGDAWAYPKLRLPAGADVGKTDAFLIRAKCEKPADVRLIVWESDGSGYVTPKPIIAADGRWHTVVVPIHDWAPLENTTDENGKLDLGQVYESSIGMNSEARENVLEVNAAYLVGPRPTK
jgi:hypothetical protein